MEETSPQDTMKAIEMFKDKYGIKAPLTTEGIDEMIKKIKESK